MMLSKNTKVKVYSLDRNTDFFNIVACVQQEGTLAPYQFIICLDYILRTSIDPMKEKDFTRKKARDRKYSTKTITDADYAGSIAILANIPTQAEFLLKNLEQAASGIGLSWECWLNGVHAI